VNARIVAERREMNFKLLVAIVSVTGTVIQVIRTILRGWPDLFPPQMRWRKIVTTKGEFRELSYLRAVKRLRACKPKHDLAHPLEQQIYKDSVESLTTRYVDVKYGYNFTGAFQAFLLCVFWLILCPIVLVEFRSSDPRLSMQVIAFIVVLLMMVSGIFFFLLFLVLSTSDSASIPGSINAARRKKLLKRECSQEVSLFQLQDLLLKNVEFVFVDGTVRSGYQASSLGMLSGVISLCSGSPEDESVGLVASEWRGVKTGEEYKHLIKQLVQSRLLSCYLDAGERPQFIVVSEYGISSIEVTRAIQESGFIAHNLGKIENRVIPVKKKIEELRLLREAGLL
jgi:hypothetical protein